MRIVGLSHIGNSRDNQEDNFLICGEYLDLDTINLFSKQKPYICRDCTVDDYNTLVAVSDGMGGHSSGEIASFLTLKYLSDYCFESNVKDESKIQAIISAINANVSNASKDNPAYRGMGATLCGFVCCDNNLFGFNVGDSRLYHYCNGNLMQLSTDHSEGQRLFDLKLLDENDLKCFQNRKAIYKYIGMKSELAADLFDIKPCPKGTIILICTDGLTDVISDLEIQEMLYENIDLKNKGEKLLNTALKRNIDYGDNITIVLTEF